MSFSSLGWNAAFAAAFEPHSAAGLVPARIALQHKNAYEVLSADGPLAAACTGRLLYEAPSRADLPAVGDWVAIRLRTGEPLADIHAVLPRATKFSRRAPGGEKRDAEQVVATNVDTVFLVTALDQNYNLRRIERYLTVAWESGAQPVVLLNKADLHPNPAAVVAEVESIALGVSVIALSALDAAQGDETKTDAVISPAPAHGTSKHALRDVTDALAPWLLAGRTLAFLGSSGVGKSTLINRLLGTERQRTGAISDAVAKGRHTTTHRELIATPSGFLVIDTPGMRELQLWDAPERALDATFADIAAFAAACRFADCSHCHEPDCAVQTALEDGTLDENRWRSFQKLQREQAYAARKADPLLARETKNHWRKIHRAHRAANRLERDE